MALEFYFEYDERKDVIQPTKFARSEVLTAMLVKFKVFSYMTVC